MSEKTFWQTIETTGEQLLATIKQIIEAGNVRRIRVRQRDRVIAEFPLTIGVVGTLIAPIAAAIGALTAVLTECTIDVERVEPAGKADAASAKDASSGPATPGA